MTSVDKMLSEFGKKYKKDFTYASMIPDPLRLPTGLFQLDLAMGGGIPLGRITLVYGLEGTMKTSICLKLIAQAQAMYPDKRAAFVDVEGHFSPSWAEEFGVDTEKLAYILPDTAEQMVDMVENLIYADDLSVIVVDSLAALVSARELKADAETAQVGTQGLLINKFYRRVTHAMNAAKEDGLMPTLILINQIRYKIGVMYGSPETMPGGPSFKFASSMTIKLYVVDDYDTSIHPTLPVWKKINATIKKWKVPIVNRSAKFSVALVPIVKYGITTGQTYDMGTIITRLKAFEWLEKVGGGQFELTLHDTGEILLYGKQKDFKEAMFSDPEFSNRVRGLIIKEVLNSGDFIDPE